MIKRTLFALALLTTPALAQAPASMTQAPPVSPEEAIITASGYLGQVGTLLSQLQDERKQLVQQIRQLQLQLTAVTKDRDALKAENETRKNPPKDPPQ